MALLTARPTSPTEGIHIVEDFAGNGTITTNLVGKHGWTITALGNGGTHTYLTTILDNDPPFGGFRHVTDVTATGDGNALTLLAATLKFPTSVGGGGFAFRFNLPDIASNIIAGNEFYVGVHTSVSVTAPTDGISIQNLSGVLTLRSDSADHGDTSQALAGVGTLTSGTTAVKGVPHSCEVHWSGENGQGGPRIVEAFVDDEPAGSLLCNIDNDEAATLAIVQWNSGAGNTLESDIHFFEYWQFMNYPTAPAV